LLWPKLSLSDTITEGPEALPREKGPRRFQAVVGEVDRVQAPIEFLAVQILLMKRRWPHP